VVTHLRATTEEPEVSGRSNQGRATVMRERPLSAEFTAIALITDEGRGSHD
jgi:hypothetical protein